MGPASAKPLQTRPTSLLLGYLLGFLAYAVVLHLAGDLGREGGALRREGTLLEGAPGFLDHVLQLGTIQTKKEEGNLITWIGGWMGWFCSDSSWCRVRIGATRS